MFLKLSFTLLLASILVGQSADIVDAAPVPRSSGMVTLPLRRVVQRDGVHPQILLQQNMNHAHRRYARMTGRQEPSHEQLRSNLERRLDSVNDGQLAKRYNRYTPKTHVSANNLVARKKKGKKAAAAAAAAAGINNAGAADPAAADPAAGAADPAAGAANPAAGAADPAGGAAASDVTAAVNPTAANSLGLSIEANDVSYLATVQMGTPPRDFTILMDSGSADLWVGSENCQSDQGGGCGTHNFLGPQSSSTFADNGTSFQVTYGTGSVSGDIVTDNVVVAGLALNQHTFGVANTESVQFSDNSVPFDGLMGLAQSTLSQEGTLTPVEALASNGLINAAIASYKISRLADNKNDGEITFGGLDATKFDAATLVTLPNVSQQGFWEGAMDAVSVDGTDLGLTGRTSILDTGTTLIVAPPADAAAVHAAIQGAKSDGQGGFTVPCTTTASVALTFGGTAFAIDPRDIAFQPVDPTNPTGDCVSGISSGQIGGANEWLVGDVFLKNAYFSTDVGQNQISLAKLV